MSDIIFRDKLQKYKVIISKTAYNNMIFYCQNSNDVEIGGILIGNYSSDSVTAYILQATDKPVDSKCLKRSFIRGNEGLIDVLDYAWKQGRYYVGEWHFHPNSLSIPSMTDMQQMNRLSVNQKLHCPEPILVIIGKKKQYEMTVQIHFKDIVVNLLRE